MRDDTRKATTALVTLALLAIAWGAIPLFVRNDVPSTQLVGVRVTFGAIALIAVAAATRRLSFPKVRRGRLALSGVLLALHWITFFESIKLTTVAVALAVLYLGPIGAAILSGPILGERVDRRLWMALSVAAVGTLLVVQPWQPGVAAGRGLMMSGLSAALLAALMIVGKPVAQDLGGLTMAMGELIIASFLLAPATYGALTQNAEHIVNFLILGAVFTGFAGFLYWEMMRHLPVAATSVVMYIEPASAVVWAALLLGEIPNVTAWLGVGLVVGGGLLAATVAAKDQEAIGAQAAL
ncbi:MAG: DMT family transporter [Actinomycetota bacterium]|nr:DMT family transporter [Actinomycetota bacterium]MDK1017364.1 DMT family transporter [Actinomycetota bacterium]MDK1026905.1 DMT family transporter [Actinomycetota bacterium]MDK1039076.1 DMT family transporter [Actinomycetota bacterium]MDK1096137.1 DMT family transporter [Actinomycetota bacterium]